MRKDFPQKLGMTIVVVAGIGFVVLAVRRTTFYLGIILLVVSVIVDALLYALVGTVTVCYQCRAEFRDVPTNPKHEGFELAIAENYRGQPK